MKNFKAKEMLICGALYLSSYNGNLDSDIYQHVFSGIVNHKVAIAMVVLGAFFVLTNSGVIVTQTVTSRGDW